MNSDAFESLAHCSDDTIDAALKEMSPPALLAALVTVTGDHSLLRPELRPSPLALREDTAGLSPEALATLRTLAAGLLRRYRDEGMPATPPLSREQLARTMSFCAGEDLSDDYVDMMLAELHGGTDDDYGISWRNKPAEQQLEKFRVLIIGAGMSGLCAAIRLDEAGIAYTIVEKNEGVAGTWFENSYPGCRVDVQNHFYSYSFEPNHDWPEFYSRRNELKTYFESCARKYGVAERIRFSTVVEQATYDEARAMWKVDLTTPDGPETIEVNAVISAVGQLNRPKLPDIAGLDRFKGPAFHSARWQHDHDLKGKRVAVIGTGASAMQFAPELAREVERLIIFQRSPQWAAPNPDYGRTVGDGMKWLLKNVPGYASWYRFLLFWRTGDGLHASLQTDPGWPHPERSMNARNDAQRAILTQHIEQVLGGRPDLLEKALPHYPPMGKRMLIDNHWFEMLCRDNIDLVTDPIREIESDAVVTENGQRQEVDAIVFGTGFQSHRFLWPMRIVGRGGVVLSEVWGENPRAYLGVAVPRFPNFFCLYGPNTNLGHGGSIIFHTECQVRYTLRCLRELLESAHSSMDCRPYVHEEYNDRVDAAHSRMIWTHPGMQTWYRNEEGRVTTNSPWRLVDYWKMTREPNPTDYEFT